MTTNIRLISGTAYGMVFRGVGCIHALSPLSPITAQRTYVKQMGLTIHDPLPHPSVYQVSTAYEECLVPIDTSRLKNFSLRNRVGCRIGIGGVKSKETRHMDWYQNTTRRSYI